MFVALLFAQFMEVRWEVCGTAVVIPNFNSRSTRVHWCLCVGGQQGIGLNIHLCSPPTTGSLLLHTLTNNARAFGCPTSQHCGSPSRLHSQVIQDTAMLGRDGHLDAWISSVCAHKVHLDMDFGGVCVCVCACVGDQCTIQAVTGP